MGEIMWEGEEDERKLRWPARLFFTGVLFFIAGAVLYFMLGTSDPEYYWRSQSPTGPMDYTDAVLGERIVLEADRDCVMKKLNLVYRGVEEGRVLIEVTLLELDASYAYKHRIPIKKAKKGIQLGGRYFRLVSWGRSRISLELLVPPH